MMVDKLALFPLNTVLFPGAPLTLHIFEERYRLMIGHCLEHGHPFGVVFIQDDNELSLPILPYSFGTVAQINANVRLEDGRFLIATIGQQRFHIQHMLQYDPYIIASVHLLPEEDDTGMDPETRRLRAIYERYWKAVAAATGTASQAEQLPDSPVATTYYLAHRMQVTNERKQHWLETNSRTRIREIASMLLSEMHLLPRPGEGESGGMLWPWSWN